MATSTLGSGTLVLAGTTSGTTTVTATAVAGTTTLTLPAATDTLVGKATTDTLTNKTLTGAAMNGTLGATTPSTVAATTLTTSSTVTHNGGTANGVAYLDGSKVLTTGSALVFDGTNLGVGVTPSAWTAYKVLQINKGSFLSSGTNAFVGSNWYYDGTDKFITNDYATFYRQYIGVHSWHVSTISGASANDPITFTQAMTLDASGRLGLGTSSPTTPLQIQTAAATGVNSIFCTGSTTAYNFWTISNTSGNARIGVDSSSGGALATGSAAYSTVIGSPNATPLHLISNGVVGATLDTSGNLLVGLTSTVLYLDGKTNSSSSSAPAFCGRTSGGSGVFTNVVWNDATSGDNGFVLFGTEGTFTTRGAITYNRAGGLVAYNTTSDYRSKVISGPIIDSGALIDSVPVYMGTMKGATQERPMFIAHEVPAYAHTGEKDAVDKDGSPVYQQMDASALIPVMWAEIQSLRKRLAALESA